MPRQWSREVVLLWCLVWKFTDSLFPKVVISIFSNFINIRGGFGACCKREKDNRKCASGEEERKRFHVYSERKRKVFYRASKMAAKQREEKNITFWQTNCSFWYTFQIPSQSEFIYFYSCVILAYSRLAIFFILILSTMSCLDMFWRSYCPDELFWILDFFLKIDFKF